MKTEQMLEQLLSEFKEMKDEMKDMKSEMKDMRVNMATKSDLQNIEQKIEQLSISLENSHLESIKTDELILKTVQEIQSSVQYVNHRIADTEMKLHVIKNVNN